MANVNKIILIGNLTRDPQLKYLPSQMAVCEFALAINHKYKTASGEQREEVCFIECTAFSKGGEIINQYVKKGNPLYVEGRLKYDTWEDKNGGGKRSKHVVVVDNFQFLGGRDGGGAPGGGEEGGGGYQDQRPSRPAPARPAAAARPPQQAPPADPPYGDEQVIKEDDIPF